jgi:response regulator of citrate/malate metabolism
MAVYSDLSDESSKFKDMKNKLRDVGVFCQSTVVILSQVSARWSRKNAISLCLALPCLQKLESSLQMKQQNDRTANGMAERLGVSDEGSE